MAFVVRERIFETSVSTGEGNFTLAGATQGGKAFSSVLSVNDTFWYKIVDISGNTLPYDYEVGVGIWLGSSTFQRAAVIESSDNNNQVSFGSGQKLVFMETPAYVMQDVYQRALGALQADENLHSLTSPSQARASLGLSFGKQTLPIMAAAMVPRTTNGPAPGLAQMTTNQNMVRTLDFDQTTQQFAQFDVPMPKQWDEGTVTFIPYWSHASGANFGVAWGLSAVAMGDNETLDAAFGTAATVTDVGGTANRLYVGAESGAITIAGTPQAGDLVQFRVHRDPNNGSDNLTANARLHGIKLLFSTDTSNDN